MSPCQLLEEARTGLSLSARINGQAVTFLSHTLHQAYSRENSAAVLRCIVVLPLARCREKHGEGVANAVQVFFQRDMGVMQRRDFADDGKAQPAAVDMAAQQ